MKLHLCCGTVYLKDWVNIDLNLPHHFLAKDRPDLVKINQTSIDNYYKEDVRRKDFLSGKFHKKKVVCDKFCDIRKLPYRSGSIEEILIVQTFEHFTMPECSQLLDSWLNMLEKGGKLHIDVPDLEGNIKIYQKAEDSKSIEDEKWAIRLIAGSHKNKYAIHKSHFTKRTLKDMLENHGFVHVKINNMIEHTYPAFGMDAYKSRTMRKKV